jgi:hypothetical protein
VSEHEIVALHTVKLQWESGVGGDLIVAAVHQQFPVEVLRPQLAELKPV